jgi:hypothetical protein
MSNDRKQRLMALGAEVLADALLELACSHDAVDNLVESMIATPKENSKRFKAKLAGLRRRRRFIRWSESAAFARDLATLLKELKAGVHDPRSGAELVAAFYETDKGTLGKCDDSSGLLSELYRIEARELFVTYASRCQDKDWLAELVLNLNSEDGFGVRDALVNCATEYLPEANIRTLISRLQDLAAKEDDEYQKRRWVHLVESLARQIKDADLFAETKSAAWEELPAYACLDIAEVYFESGDAETALSWLERIRKDDGYRTAERDGLLMEIHGQLGNTEKQAEVAWRSFRRNRCENALQKLLAIIGQDQRETVVAGEVDVILAGEVLAVENAEFLLEVGRVDEAALYLFDRREQLNGDLYGSLLPLAERLEAEGRILVASVLYRALLDSILRRAQPKTYSRGVRYLQKLETLAKSVSDWNGVADHGVYMAGLRQQHARKTSFWSRYGQ